MHSQKMFIAILIICNCGYFYDSRLVKNLLVYENAPKNPILIPSKSSNQEQNRRWGKLLFSWKIIDDGHRMRNFITCVFCTQTSTVSLFSNLLKKVTELITHASTKAYYRQQHLWRKSTFEMPPGEVRHEISRVIRACVKSSFSKPPKSQKS